MKVKTFVLGRFYNGGDWVITYRYWIDGDCECGAKKIERLFKSKNPTEDELVRAV